MTDWKTIQGDLAENQESSNKTRNHDPKIDIHVKLTHKIECMQKGCLHKLQGLQQSTCQIILNNNYTSIWDTCT